VPTARPLSAGRTLRAIVRRVRPEDLAFAPDAFELPTGRAPIRVTWLGTAGFAIEHDGFVLLIDPYLTRASMLSCLRAPLRSDRARIERYAPKAHAIVAGHTHFDHVLDVPSIALATGGRGVARRSCARLCRGPGGAEGGMVDVEGGARPERMRAEAGPFELRFVPSCHSAFALGRIPWPGDISDCEQVPLATSHYRCGAVFGVDVRVAGKRLYHLGSADLLDGMPERGVDLLLMCVAGWTTTERFAPRVMGALRPGAILLSHWDDFFSPMQRCARPLPAIQMPRLVDRVTANDPSVRGGTVPTLGVRSL